MKPIKVLHIINSLNTGGAQVCLKDITGGEFENVEHYIYTLRPDSGKFSFDVPVFNSGYRNYDIRKFSYLIKLCKELNIDIVHAHLHKSCMFAVLLKFFYPCKTVLHEHGPIARKGATFTFYRLFLRLFGGKADRVIAVSQNIKNKLSAVLKGQANKITVVYNCVDTARFRSDASARAAYRRKYAFDDNTFVIGFIGRLSKVKGVDIAIEAFNEARKKSPENLKLLIVGDGVEEEKLKKTAAKSSFASDIVFAGFCSEAEKIINAFDIAVVPSRQEPFGIVVLELLACKVPVIGSSAEGIKEIITDGIDGIITDGSSKEIAMAICKLKTNSNLRAIISQAGIKIAYDYSLTSYISKIRNLYFELFV